MGRNKEKDISYSLSPSPPLSLCALGRQSATFVAFPFPRRLTRKEGVHADGNAGDNVQQQCEEAVEEAEGAQPQRREQQPQRVRRGQVKQAHGCGERAERLEGGGRRRCEGEAKWEKGETLCAAGCTT